MNTYEGLQKSDIPAEPTVEFLIAKPGEKKLDTEGIVVYCIDVSGSMSVSSELPQLQGIKYYKNNHIAIKQMEI